MDIGTTGGGGLRKVGGGTPSRSIVCHASRSAASCSQRALSRSNYIKFNLFLDVITLLLNYPETERAL